MKNPNVFVFAWMTRTREGGNYQDILPGFLLGVFFTVLLFSLARLRYRTLNSGQGALKRLWIITAAAQGMMLFGFFTVFLGLGASAVLGSLFSFTGLFLFLFCAFNTLSWKLKNRGASRKENALLAGLGLFSVLGAGAVFVFAALTAALLFALFRQYRYRPGFQISGLSYLRLSLCIVCVMLSMTGPPLLSALFWGLPVLLWHYPFTAPSGPGPDAGAPADRIPDKTAAPPAAGPRKEDAPPPVSGAGEPENAGAAMSPAEAAAGEDAEEAELGFSDVLDEAVLAGRRDPAVMNPFVPPAFLKILNRESVADLKLGDHVEKEMTIFFSDIRQFSHLMENLSTEESFKFINSYLSRIVPIITGNGGFVDKYIGDAIMALFPQKNGADQAVRSAIEIQKKILEYNEHRAKMGYRSLSMGIGIHTGPMMMGVVGVEDRMQGTVISDAVNLASRIEGMCKAYNVSLVISGDTFKNLENPGDYMYRYLGGVKLRGKGIPIPFYEILDAVTPDVLERKMKANRFFEEGMMSFRKKKYSEALLNFRRVLELLPEDGATLAYVGQCMTKLNDSMKVV